ncbi:hypothetical protein D3C78_659760 [compost metagenome]
MLAGKRLRWLSYLAMSSLSTTTLRAPSAVTCWAMASTVMVPSTGWPPVMATASLNRIL